MGAHTPRWFIGLMSGTSLDGVDGVLADLSEEKCRLAQAASASLAPEFKAELLALNRSGSNELHRAQLAANALARTYAAVVQRLLAQAGLPAHEVEAIGAHGQTVRHQPQAFDGTGYTLQLNNPALLAELTGIAVVADLRSRDVAAGGQGAPLVPAFHRHAFGQPGQTVAVLNIGGMANLSILAADDTTAGLDCGPGNVLMDGWCQAHTGKPYDAEGRWARSGHVLPALLRALLAEPFFAQAPPKSTGRNLFHPQWLATHLQASGAANARPEDVQATLLELTARTCAADVQRHAAGATTLIVCGGGARNTALLQRLSALLSGLRVDVSDDHGLPAQQVEAAAFAWLAQRCIDGLPGNLAAVTGARGPRVLGAIYPA